MSTGISQRPPLTASTYDVASSGNKKKRTHPHSPGKEEMDNECDESLKVTRQLRTQEDVPHTTYRREQGQLHRCCQ